MQGLEGKIKESGSLFYGRLNTGLLQDAISYVDHNERGLAFETICDHLSEYDIPMTEEECCIAIDLLPVD
ncbi:MafI family immunity protein [Cronobacter turicensis]|uniref:MafI family immunity protein n=1 Tax=Cronobacter turicensis TaxID=413502 RepID=UPI00293826F5|nr:MafI family immunity protein [Cronobacter turicensis]